MKIVFLDIDGVLNCEDGYKSGQCSTRDKYGQDFYQPSKEFLNKLIEETGSEVVISSTWRAGGLREMQSMWKDRGMSGKVIGVTPHHETRMRGLEIETYLGYMGSGHVNWSKEQQQEYIDKSGVENYIIIDDDSDMLYNQRNNFIHVLPSPRNTSGFNYEYYSEALGKLSRTVIDLNYDN